MRLITNDENARHGCAWCAKITVKRAHYIKGVGYENTHRYCPFLECTYKEELEKYRSYTEYDKAHRGYFNE